MSWRCLELVLPGAGYGCLGVAGTGWCACLDRAGFGWLEPPGLAWGCLGLAGARHQTSDISCACAHPWLRAWAPGWWFASCSINRNHVRTCSLQAWPVLITLPFAKLVPFCQSCFPVLYVIYLLHPIWLGYWRDLSFARNIFFKLLEVSRSFPRIIVVRQGSTNSHSLDGLDIWELQSCQHLTDSMDVRHLASSWI